MILRSHSIPVTTFEGVLKQVRSEDLDEKRTYAVDAVFPSFRRLDQYLSGREWGTLSTGLGSRVFYVGRGRERRYAGDKTLSRGRYYAVCNDDSGDDFGTLVNELKAYYSYESRVPCEIFDNTISEDSANDLAEFNHDAIGWPHILLRIGPKTPNHVENYITGMNCPIIHIPLPLNVVNVKINDVLDLRLPEAQAWFYSHFLRLEAELRVVSGSFHLAVQTQMRVLSFQDMIPVLIAQEIGGSNPFLQGVGAWLRSHGVSALIYPSARSDFFSLCQPNGTLKYWRGWNLVLYEGSEPVDWRVHFGRLPTWRPFVPPTYKTELWDDYIGFGYTGVSEWTERRFRASLQLALTDSSPSLMDLTSGLFSLLDIDPSRGT